jgi:formate C-acetyltransferase
LEDFFISFNKDSDLYPGVQQGDNGQSMVLGGIDEEGKPVFNLLSRLCLTASGNLKLIDPKINLRVSKDTPVVIYEIGSELTKAGMGFPQYTNDDVIISGLERLGYEHEDALNYAIAACWEIIIPKAGMDVVNIAALSFPKVIDRAFRGSLMKSDTFDSFLEAVRDELFTEIDRLTGGIKDLWFVPSPFLNLLMERDIAQGGKYNNFGIHGTGIATAADSLAAIQKYVYEEKRIDKEVYLEAIESNFETHDELLPLLRQEAPKMGQDDDRPDLLGVRLLDWFAESLRGKRNCRGGIYRPGTGSAMYYLWHAGELGASPDGRRKGEPFGTNLSVSLFANIPGPLSVIKSFTKFSFNWAVNGGPLTLEFHHQMFNNPESVGKVARLVKDYIDRGGHQLQLNAVNIDKMRDAQLHPENHKQLVARIWGWSAYFVELDKAYQDHVIARQEYSV